MTLATALDPALYENPFRRALSHGRPLPGLWSMLNSSDAIEGLGWAGFDWILIDGEHAPVSLNHTVNHLRAISATPTVPIVRVPTNDTVLLKQYLDIGAQTLMVPFVQSADEARAAVRAIHYPKDGIRGFAAMHRASRYGHVTDYVHRAHEGLYLIVQIETPEACERVAEIAAVPGVDAVFFGPGDLSASLGWLGQPARPEVTAMIEKALAAVKGSGKAAGVLAPNPDLARHYLSAGFDFVSVASDCSLLFGSARVLAAGYQARTVVSQTSVRR